MGRDHGCEMSVEVTVKFSDLKYTRYEYWLNDTTLYLNKMLVLERLTTRHKLKVDFRNSYFRVDHGYYGIKEEPDVEIEIQQEALRIARGMIKVERWIK